MNNLLRGAAVAVAVLISTQAKAGLVGTDLTLSVLAEATPGSPTFVSSFPRVATVSATAVEFPNVQSLFNPNDPEPPGFGALVNVSIDAGDNFITINFQNAGSGSFASAFKNGYLFEFDSQALATITGATLDNLTTLGLVSSDVTFSGNQLFVNVEGLGFNPNSFVKIDLTVEGGPTATPEPSTLALLLVGAVALGGVAWRKRKCAA